jgi:hypothetical protein
MSRKSKTPHYDAAVAWLGQAKKGEVYVYWRGHLDRACNTPEQNMSNAERRNHQAACRAARKNKTTLPKPPDPFKPIRADARAVREWAEHQEIRGLVDLKTIVHDKRRVYEMKCIVQRNGLAAVRARR